MTSMEDRERAFENMFAHDLEMRFRAEARRNKMLGLWAAGLLGKADVEAYAQDLVLADLEKAGTQHLVRKLRADFDAAGIDQTDENIQSKMLEFLTIAVEQVREV